MTGVPYTYQFGATVTGRVCDEHTFRQVRPKRIETGRVVGIYPYAARYALITTESGETVLVRT